jgi:hypothetical protein
MTSRRITWLVAIASLFGGRVWAQDPKFQFGKQEEVKEIEWKAQAKAGLVLTTGNSQTATVTAGTLLSRKEKENKFSFDAGLAYAKSSIFVVNDINMNGTIDNRQELQRLDSTTANQWFAKARYDRFFTEHNSAYVSANFAGDEVAGKDLDAGGQIGYSRQVYKDDKHESIAELGYDLMYEKLSASPDAVIIHSARIFLGHTSKLTSATSVFANFEVLFNLNTEDKAFRQVGMDMKALGVDAFDDTRINAKAGLTTTLWKSVSFAFSYALKYDHAPAPLPPPKGAMFAADFTPFAETLDTITEAALVVNFF